VFLVGLAAACGSDSNVQNCYSTTSGLVCVAAATAGLSADVNSDGQEDPFFCARSEDDDLHDDDLDRDDDGISDDDDDDDDSDGRHDDADDDDDDDGIDDSDECERCNRGPGESGEFRFDVRGDEWELNRGRVASVDGSVITILSPVVHAGSATLVVTSDAATSIEGALAAGAEIEAHGNIVEGVFLAEEIRVLCPH
jgi:hypothetical protein